MKCAVVSGAGAGIGAATAKHLTDNGYRVVGIDLRGDVAVQGDVSDPETWQRALELCDGAVDALVSNAFTVAVKPLDETTPAEWERQLAVNLGGAFHGLRACLPSLRERKGAVVLVSSVHAHFGIPGHGAYAAIEGRAGRADPPARRRVRAGRPGQRGAARSGADGGVGPGLARGPGTQCPSHPGRTPRRPGRGGLGDRFPPVSGGVVRDGRGASGRRRLVRGKGLSS